MTTLDMLWAIRDLRDARLRLAHAATLLALLAHREQDGAISPSIQQLAEATHADPKTVRRALRELEEWEFLTTRKRVSRLGEPLSNVYELTLRREEVLPKLEVSPEAAVPPDSAGRTPAVGTTSPQKRQGVLPGTVPSEDLSPDHPEDPLPEEAATSAKAAKRGSRLPPDWTPTDELLSFARERGVDDVTHLVDHFRNHWAAAAGAKATKVDWSAAFRTWVLNDVQWRRQRAAPRAPASRMKQPMVGKPAWALLPSQRSS